MRVAPGAPDSSYLIAKLTGVNMCSGERMPRGGAALPAAQIDTIRSWISGLWAGAGFGLRAFRFEPHSPLTALRRVAQRSVRTSFSAYAHSGCDAPRREHFEPIEAVDAVGDSSADSRRVRPRVMST
jgi:hypothetical protein